LAILFYFTLFLQILRKRLDEKTGWGGKLQHGWTESELLLLKPKTLRLKTKKGAIESGWLCGSKSTFNSAQQNTQQQCC
jgi:hypothetical protein